MARAIFFHRPWGMPIYGLLYGMSRYAERNPVRVKMVTKAEDYSWSSAVAHCGLEEDAILSQKSEREKQCDQISNWSSWLAEGDELEKLELLRRNIEKGLPCGEGNFIGGLKRIAGRLLRYRPLGCPRSEEEQ